MATMTETLTTIPSSERAEAGSFNIPVADFPSSSKTSPNDVDKVATDWTSAFNEALSNRDYLTVSDLFLEGGYWRDHLALSWDFHTTKGPQNITNFMKEYEDAECGCRLKALNVDRTSQFRAPHTATFDGKGNLHGVEIFLTITTRVGSGQGIARLVEQDGKWKAFSLYTSLRELKGHEEATFGRRSKGVEHGGKADRKNWLERRTTEINYDCSQPAVLILGKVQLHSNTKALLT
jgi:hypothetical protein